MFKKVIKLLLVYLLMIGSVFLYDRIKHRCPDVATYEYCPYQ